MNRFNDLVEKALEEGASDIHLVVGHYPRLRINGVLQEETGFGKVESSWILELLPPDIKNRVERNEIKDYDFAYQTRKERFRVNVFRELAGLAATLRHVPSTPPELDSLGLPASIRKITTLKRGLVVVTGPTGSGKSTTLAAIINEINKTRRERIITIEDPIEFVHENKKSFISHREVGRHTDSFAAALRSALREDPDIILIGEMRDLETMDLALKAALTGHLVLATLHTISAAKTVDRIIDVFPESVRSQVRADLADTIEAVVSQSLLPRTDGNGRIVAVEVMFANTAIRSLIREGKTFQIPMTIQNSQKEGMILFDDYLIHLLQKKLISDRTAYFNAVDKKKMGAIVKNVNINIGEEPPKPQKESRPEHLDIKSLLE